MMLFQINTNVAINRNGQCSDEEIKEKRLKTACNACKMKVHTTQTWQLLKGKWFVIMEIHGVKTPTRQKSQTAKQVQGECHSQLPVHTINFSIKIFKNSICIIHCQILAFKIKSLSNLSHHHHANLASNYEELHRSTVPEKITQIGNIK